MLPTNKTPMTTSISGTLTLALVLAQPALSLAHTGVASTSPKNGAILERSPAAIEIEFRGETRLTSVVAIATNKAERKLQFAPKSSATSFKLPNPELEPGRNKILWKGLSKDGHVVSGTLVYIIDPAKTN